jgi:hypothetical protein
MKSEPQQNGAKQGNEPLLVYRQDHARGAFSQVGDVARKGKGRWHMGLHELRTAVGTTDGKRLWLAYLRRVQMF